MLRARYALSGTELAYGATSLPPLVTTSGFDEKKLKVRPPPAIMYDNVPSPTKKRLDRARTWRITCVLVEIVQIGQRDGMEGERVCGLAANHHGRRRRPPRPGAPTLLGRCLGPAPTVLRPASVRPYRSTYRSTYRRNIRKKGTERGHAGTERAQVPPRVRHRRGGCPLFLISFFFFLCLLTQLCLNFASTVSVLALRGFWVDSVGSCVVTLGSTWCQLCADAVLTFGIAPDVCVNVGHYLGYHPGVNFARTYLGYNAFKNFFPGYSLYPNPQCEDSHCCKNQTAFKAWKEKGGKALKGWEERVDAEIEKEAPKVD
eukprot:3038761-Rhodomonas_salina.1